MELIYKKSECKTYKDFYEKICKDLKLEEDMDLCDYENLAYSADMLNEFLWYNHDKNIKYRFIGFDLEIIKQEKTVDDYKYKLIFEVFEYFVSQYPNNVLEIIKEEK